MSGWLENLLHEELLHMTSDLFPRAYKDFPHEEAQQSPSAADNAR